HRLDEFAEREPSVDVRQQLASSAARLPAGQALPIINANINRDLNLDDPYVPLLWWWAVERHSVTGREEVLKRFVRPSLWKSRLGREFLLTRLIRRYAAEGTAAGDESVVRLLKAAPNDAARDTLWPHVLMGLQSAAETSTARQELSALVFARWQRRPEDPTLLQLSIALGNRAPYDAALREALDPQAAPARRVLLLNMLEGRYEAAALDDLLSLVASSQPEAVRSAALKGLSRFDDPRIAAALIAESQKSTSPAWQAQIRSVMFGRESLARFWLQAVDRGTVPPAAVPLDDVRRIALLANPELDALVTKHWGRLQSASREEKLAEVRRLNNDLRAGPGDLTAGRAVYKKHCANCHQMFGEGTKLGPDLTTANRRDRDFLLVSLVDSSSVIRKEFVSVVVETVDGRVLTGLAVSRDDAGVTLVDAKNQRTTIAASEIAALRESEVSLMPDDLYRQLKPQELRDLFAYLQSSPPGP
ncbi:MAG: c-type cytochrome, partial [Planctomycetaceae bacterium]|nr:c-type cytochrome [Planctomycetaceae bacterium]